MSTTTLHRALRVVTDYRLAIMLTLTLAVAAVTVEGFLKVSTLGLSLDRASTIGLIALGLTVLLIAGQIDLSGGSIMALSGITAMSLQPSVGLPVAVLAALGVGALVGLVNGVLVVRFEINSLVATLATMLAVRAVAHIVTGSQPVSGSDPLAGAVVVQRVVGVLTLRTVVFLVLLALLHVWLTRTVAGRNLLAVGSNVQSATGSGVRADAYLFGAFVFGGLCSGAAGVLLSLGVNTGSPVFGETIVVTVIAAVVVGGTRLEGGRGSALGTLGGVVTFGAITTALEFQSVPAYTQQVVTGAILIALIVLDRNASRRRALPPVEPAAEPERPLAGSRS
jgi:ribose/xylose/arabinose/galactoside ABC-type transport system permease subunit